MRIFVLAVASWAAALVVVAGLFVATVRGGGGTEAAPLPEPVRLIPEQAPLPGVAMPEQRTSAESEVRGLERT